MLLTTPEDIAWRRRSYWALIGLCASYLWYGLRQYPHGGSWMGITYGIVGLIVMLVLMYYGVRKRSYKSSFGTLETWLHSHIYLGVLVLLIILFHSGFRFHDKIAVTALILLSLVVLSGVIGAILYTVVPPKLIRVESNLAAAEISDQMNQLAQSMARLASGKTAAFREVCSYLIEAEQPEPMAGWRILRRAAWRKADEANRLTPLLSRVDRNEQTDLTQLLVLARQIKELHDRLVQKQRYVNMMAVWLYVHVPLTFGMMVAVVAHITAFFYYW